MQSNFYTLTAPVWLTRTTPSWHFVSIPRKQTEEITQAYKHLWRGWRSLPVEVSIGKTRWHTSIFLDWETHTYLLPLKAKVRKNENIAADQIITCTIEILGLFGESETL